MDDLADIYYVDNRNAFGRFGVPGALRGPVPAPVNRPLGGTPTSSPLVAAAFGPNAYPAFGQTAYPMAPYAAAYGQSCAINPYTGQMMPVPGSSVLGSLFGSMPIGQILELVAAGFAALASLPAAPVATKDMETDLANLILYQSALATHAKRDEQIRTIGSLVGKLVR